VHAAADGWLPGQHISPPALTLCTSYLSGAGVIPRHRNRAELFPAPRAQGSDPRVCDAEARLARTAKWDM